MGRLNKKKKQFEHWVEFRIVCARNQRAALEGHFDKNEKAVS